MSIIDAISHRDAPTAEKLMRRHFQKAIEKIKAGSE
jgi:DNA-binding GntR family transcriptional regulator